MTTTLTDKPAAKYFRASPARGIVGSDAIDRAGGKFKAGLIRNVSAITRGEALGHGMWVDAEMLNQVQAALEVGNYVKSRFTHPDISSDGMGKMLGRAYVGRLAGDRVVVNLHFLQAAHESPDGNLAAYVMNLASEAPEDFGTSIVFTRDRDAEMAFAEEHTREVQYTDPETGETETRRRFRSPDPDNQKHLRHVRLKQLRAVDVVDDPAANPNGLFHRAPDQLRDGEALMSYALGLSDAAPELMALEVHPDRVAGFVQRFLDRNGLQIGPKFVKEDGMSKDTGSEVGGKVGDQGTETQAGAELSAGNEQASDRDQVRTELKAYVDAFGAEKGSEWYFAGRTLEECYRAHSEELKAQLASREQEGDEEKAQLKKQLDAANDKLEQLGRGEGEDTAVSFGSGEKKENEGGQAPAEFEGRLSTGMAQFAAGLKLRD